MDLSSLQRQLPQILSKKREKVSRFFTVESLDLRFSNNTEATYERIYGGNGAVMAVPFDGRDFYLISEYACGFERYERFWSPQYHDFKECHDLSTWDDVFENALFFMY